MKLLFIGDIVGRAGRRAVRELMPAIKEEEEIDFVIANGENAAGGFGITNKVAEELYGYGIDVLTMGNHTWDNKEIFDFIDDDSNLIRPYNYPPGTPGRGYGVYEVESGIKIGVVNLLGRIFMDNVDCPFRSLEELLPDIEADFTIVDFHAEATAEKIGLGRYFDGEVAAVLGTHTHVQTADEKVLSEGTAYITDLGLTGGVESILGMKEEEPLKKLTTQLPQRFSVATGDTQLTGVIVELDLETGLAESITRVREVHLNQ
ncbi:TIGR00282 family metallophosphoesterase [Acetohalobium arabaticum]|uniref:Metallophosphoesterase n=1 Tax=Acetohalobium arabaticum (strain ATCC 49924 / DSM 5501 / Z-7288) TaxID=574087 RepID=D9QR42_ACEAZ|nr:TIGR00282 family metallophosphoesterase [Acetohalobium arabaticum]ADL12983.1 metallophosphoesterase [Acetohalobium arabaticum DSM 5501]